MRYLDQWQTLPINIIKLIDPHPNAHAMVEVEVVGFMGLLSQGHNVKVKTKSSQGQSKIKTGESNYFFYPVMFI